MSLSDRRSVKEKVGRGGKVGGPRMRSSSRTGWEITDLYSCEVTRNGGPRQRRVG